MKWGIQEVKRNLCRYRNLCVHCRCPSRQFVCSESCVNCERLNTESLFHNLLVEGCLAIQSFKCFIARTLIGTTRARRMIGVEVCSPCPMVAAGPGRTYLASVKLGDTLGMLIWLETINGILCYFGGNTDK